MWFALLTWAFYSSFLGNWRPFQFIVIGLGIGVAIGVVISPVIIKRMLITMFSSYSYRPAHLDEFPHLDLPALERLTTQWESLGFVQRGDFLGNSANPKLGTWFSRQFEHQSEGAVVTLMQQFTPTKTLPLNSSVTSLWGQREGAQRDRLELERIAAAIPPIASPLPPAPEKQPPDDLKFWASATHNRAPNRYFRLMRHPRVLGVRLEANTSPAQMWQFHRERATLIETRLGMAALRGDLPALLYAHGRVLNAILLRRIKATPAWKLALYSWNRKPASPIYDGELAPLSQ